MSQDSKLPLQMALSVTLDAERKAELSFPGDVEWFTLSSPKTFSCKIHLNGDSTSP